MATKKKATVRKSASAKKGKAKKAAPKRATFSTYRAVDPLTTYHVTDPWPNATAAPERPDQKTTG